MLVHKKVLKAHNKLATKHIQNVPGISSVRSKNGNPVTRPRKIIHLLNIMV